MESHKCVECGLMNWVDRELCKRCETPLRKLNGQLNSKTERADIEPPTLLMVNAIGTRLMGWRHSDDGTATATVWFTALFLPIFPISRHRLVSPTRAEWVPEVPSGPLQVFLPWETSSTSYLFLDRLPLSAEEVVRTYLFAYLWFPILLIGPWVVYAFVRNLTRPEIDDGSQTPVLVAGIFAMIWLGYVMFMSARLLHRSRGASD